MFSGERSRIGMDGQAEYHELLYRIENQNPFPSYEMTCAIRAIESREKNHLFYDEIAVILTTQDVIQFIDEADLIDSSRPYIAVRTKYYDNFLESVFNNTCQLINQLIIFGCGMDSRAFRLEFLADKIVYEIDQPEVIRKKNYRMGEIKRRRTNHHFIEADLTQLDWVTLLIERGYRCDLPSVWILEGVSMYFHEQQFRSIISNIDRNVAPGSYLGMDIINKKATVGRDNLWLSGFDDPEELLNGCGWSTTVIQPGEEGACFDRFIRKLPSREVADVERAFFVTAQKW